MVKAIELVDRFMNKAFEEKAEAAAWLVKGITAALEAEREAESAAWISYFRAL